MSKYGKKANNLNVLGEKKSLKGSINFIISFDFFNNYLIIEYKFSNKYKMSQNKV